MRRHAEARTVHVGIGVSPAGVRLEVRDDGRGPPEDSLERLELQGHMGLAGMRERISALGGGVRFGGRPGSGASLEVLVKEGLQRSDPDLAYTGFKIPPDFVVGYGLDVNERFRNLPFVCVYEGQEHDEYR